jgi:hypothetical protein
LRQVDLGGAKSQHRGGEPVASCGFNVGEVSELPKTCFVPGRRRLTQTLADRRRIKTRLCTCFRHAGESFTPRSDARFDALTCLSRHFGRALGGCGVGCIERTRGIRVFSPAGKLETRQRDVGISVVGPSPLLERCGRLRDT